MSKITSPDIKTWPEAAQVAWHAHVVEQDAKMNDWERASFIAGWSARDHDGTITVDIGAAFTTLQKSPELGKQLTELVAPGLNQLLDGIEKETARVDAEYKLLLAVVKLADELCVAIDEGAQDIGGHRAALDILKDMGQALNPCHELIKG